MASVKKESIRWNDKKGNPREAERWVARYRDEAGRQRKKNFNRKVDAQRWLDETTASIVTGRYVDPSAGKITLDQFYQKWSQLQIWLTTSRTSADQAVRTCSFKDLPLKKIRKSHVEGWVKEMDTRLAASTIQTRFIIVRSVLKAAVADREIAEDPATGVKLPAKPSPEAAMTIPTAEEVGKLIAHADQKKRVSTRVGFEAYAALCAFAGLRKGASLRSAGPRHRLPAPGTACEPPDPASQARGDRSGQGDLRRVLPRSHSRCAPTQVRVRANRRAAR